MKIITDPTLQASRTDIIVPLPLIKRVVDIIFSSLLLILSIPWLTLLFLMVKFEGLIKPAFRGPFLYSEIRISQGKPFTFYKIRIFKPAVLKKTLQEAGFIHTKYLEREPENLTKVGKFLKKFYLDELPQLFNIIKGDMSLVGTRPLNTVRYEAELKQGILRKKIIKAGLTGLVQAKKGEHHLYDGGDLGLDDYYIAFCKTHSPLQILLFDLKIIGLSIIKLLKGQGL